MSRKNLIRTRDFPYHVTARVNNREIFPLPLDKGWKYLTTELYNQILISELEVHAFVLMPNHFHLIAQTCGKFLDEVMQMLISSLTRIINTRTNRCGHLFGSRYHWSLIDNPTYYAHALKYTYRNPVKAGFCNMVEDWPFSTLSGLFGFVPLPFPVIYKGSYIQHCVPENLWTQLNWLNTAYSSEESDALRKALRRKLFKIPRKKSGGNFEIASRI